jgi:ketosteroid isomerase-like protein
MWLEWLAPWTSYRSEVEDSLDLGNRVVVLVRDYGRRTPDAPEIEQISAAVWTLDDGKVSDVAFYPDRAAALKAVGLEE